MWFNVIVLKERADRKREEVEHLQKNAAEVDALLDDIADYKEREKAIISIKTNRILWSKKLDELCKITPNFIWIVRMDMRELEANHDFLLKGGVFTTDAIESWIAYKRENEIDPVRMRPHPHEFELYFDI